MNAPTFQSDAEFSSLTLVGPDFLEMIHNAETVRAVGLYGRGRVAQAEYFNARMAARRVVRHIFRLFPCLRDEVLKGEIK